VDARTLWVGFGTLLLLALVLPSTVAKGVLLGLAVLLVVLAVWVAALRQAVEVAVELPDRIVHGDGTELTVVVSNTSRLPAPRIRIEVSLPGGGFTPSEAVFEAALPGRSTVRLTSPLTAFGRGHWQVRGVTALVGDGWGVHQRQATFPPPPATIVLPKLVPVRRLELPAVAPLAELPDRRSLTTDPMAIVGVRPYQPGDPLRSIHWPATAAVGTLVRRETERAWARDLLVVLDLDRHGWERDDHHSFEVAVTVAASLLVDAVLTQRQPAGLVASLPPDGVGRGDGTKGGAGPERRADGSTMPSAARFRIGGSRTHLDAMLVHLAGVQRHPGTPLPELLTRHVRLQQPGTTVAVLTGRLTGRDDGDLPGALRGLRRSGITPVLVQVARPHSLAVDEHAATGGAPHLTVPTDQTLVGLTL
jgi:uncharacterized protein (DUF58 family)